MSHATLFAPKRSMVTPLSRLARLEEGDDLRVDVWVSGVEMREIRASGSPLVVDVVVYVPSRFGCRSSAEPGVELHDLGF